MWVGRVPARLIPEVRKRLEAGQTKCLAGEIRHTHGERLGWEADPFEVRRDEDRRQTSDRSPSALADEVQASFSVVLGKLDTEAGTVYTSKLVDLRRQLGTINGLCDASSLLFQYA